MTRERILPEIDVEELDDIIIGADDLDNPHD
jgi:hypothetical protein